MSNKPTQTSAHSAPITDNVPEKVTAHTVRFLVCCSLCDGLGDRRQMIELTRLAEPTNEYQHTSCHAKANPKSLHTLSPSNLAKLRLCDLSALTDRERDKVVAAFNQQRETGAGRYQHARVRKESSGDQK